MEIIVKTNPSYKIKIEKGIVLKGGLPEGFVITDSNVYSRYKELIKGPCFVLPAGEKSKTIETYVEIIKKIGNTDKIIALGGGVVGDIAGFVASTYKRGIPLIQIPTTLLAMVDSGIGGKNGVDLGEKKNYIGTIYQPEEVLIDPDFLKDLPEEEFNNGLAEVIKYSYLFNKPPFEIMKNKITKDSKELINIVYESCKAKAEIVELDEKDKGIRHTLNFGHTIGHAIELLTGLKHGEAISIGMVKETGLAINLGIKEEEDKIRLIKALKANSLPLTFPEKININKVIGIMGYDKKGEFIFAFDRNNSNVKVNEKDIRKILI